MRARAAFGQAGLALGSMTAQPLVGGRAADAELGRDHRDRLPLDLHALHQQLPTEDGESGTTMCHEGLLCVTFGALTPRTDHEGLSLVNNVSVNHT